MPDKEKIIDNIDQYNAEELAKFIIDGEVTLKELKDAGLQRDVRIEIEEIIKQVDEQKKDDEEQKKDDEDFQTAKKTNTIAAYRQYLSDHPSGRHRAEAQKAIDDLKGGRPTPGPKTRDVILSEIKADHNRYDNKTITYYIENGFIDEDGLREIGIAQHFIDALYDDTIKPRNFAHTEPEEIQPITKPCTEVYFWGIPFSGKSCALGSILNAAEHMDGLSQVDLKDQGYITDLKNCFEPEKVSYLPNGTATDAFYEMEFEWTDMKKNKTYPITLIDLAGELLLVISKKMRNEEIESETEAKMLEILTNVLKGNEGNRQIHFFVVPYGKEDKYNGAYPWDYLNHTFTFLREKGLFNKKTDEIFLLITKSDEAESKEAIDEFLKKHYNGVIKNLNTTLKNCEIGGDSEIYKIPFTVGDICFKNYCYHTDKAYDVAKNVINLILACAKGFKGGKISKIIKKLKS